MKLPETEYAWAAGFLDGEGHFRLAQTKSPFGYKHYGSFKIMVAQTDRRVLDRLTRIIGGKVYGPYAPKTPNSKPYFQFHTIASNAVAAYKLIRPYLGEVKQKQADTALALWHTLHDRPKLQMGPRPRLNAQQILKIKHRLELGHTQAQIAKDYGISRGLIYHIKFNKLKAYAPETN